MQDNINRRVESQLLKMTKELADLEEIRKLKGQGGIGEGSIMKAISDYVITRWEHDFAPKYMLATEIN